MVRRIGFQEDQDNPEKGVADRVLDDFRAKAQAERNAEAAEKAERQAEMAEAGAKAVSIATRLARIIFPLVWLAFWTVGCVFAGTMIFAVDTPAAARVFLVVWEIAALTGWFLVARGILRELRGQ